MASNYQIRHASHPGDAKQYDTQRLRNEFLIDSLFIPNEVNMVYSTYDRMITGGAMPQNEPLLLEVIDEIKAPYFLERREMGIINVGAKGLVEADGVVWELDYKEALYLGKGTEKVVFKNLGDEPAKFYFCSSPAHKNFPAKRVTLSDARVLEMGANETSNKRRINQLIVNNLFETCQLQMGMTELQPGSVWNTMPAHTHFRRMEVYFYFEVPSDQAVCHFMGEPSETRHIWMANEQAVISPNWSIHSAAGTSSYTFIWAMAGENLDYGDMDIVTPNQLK